jgi:hypothetical protein
MVTTAPHGTHLRKWQANLIGVAVAALVVAGGLFAGAPEVRASGPSNPMHLSAPPGLAHGTAEVPIGDALELWGQPTRLDLFWTRDPVAEVTRTYVDAWKAAGFDPQVRKLDKVTSVSAVDNSTGLMRTVTVMDSGDERLVIPGLTDIRVFPDVSSAHAPVPIPEDADSFLANSADDTTSVSYSATFLMPTPADDVILFYMTEMKKRGYAEEAKPQLHHIHNGTTVEFSRGPEWVRVVASGLDAAKLDSAVKSGELPREAAGRSSCFVTVTHVRRIDQPEPKP